MNATTVHIGGKNKTETDSVNYLVDLRQFSFRISTGIERNQRSVVIQKSKLFMFDVMMPWENMAGFCKYSRNTYLLRTYIYSPYTNYD